MALDLTILVGTMTGTAERAAHAVQLAAEADDVRIGIEPIDGLGADAFSGGGPCLICTSTCGPGDVPGNAKGLYASLQSARPHRSGMQYGVIALAA